MYGWICCGEWTSGVPESVKNHRQVVHGGGVGGRHGSKNGVYTGAVVWPWPQELTHEPSRGAERCVEGAQTGEYRGVVLQGQRDGVGLVGLYQGHPVAEVGPGLVELGGQEHDKAHVQRCRNSVQPEAT